VLHSQTWFEAACKNTLVVWDHASYSPSIAHAQPAYLMLRFGLSLLKAGLSRGFFWRADEWCTWSQQPYTYWNLTGERSRAPLRHDLKRWHCRFHATTTKVRLESWGSLPLLPLSRVISRLEAERSIHCQSPSSGQEPLQKPWTKEMTWCTSGTWLYSN